MVKQQHSDAIMTLAEVAGYLKVSEKTVQRMVQSGEFPGVKVSSQWRFVRGIVDDWLSTRMHALPEKNLRGAIGTADHVIPITRLVSPRHIILDISPGTKAEVLAQLVGVLTADGLVTDAEDYVKRLLAREEMVSTAIGRGLAIPHLRDPSELQVASPLIVLGVCKAGTDFESLDGKKTFVFALPCSGAETIHLKLLAKIALVFRQPRVLEQIQAAETAKAIMEILAITDHDLMQLG